MLVKARKIHSCIYCGGNIQKGELHEHVKIRMPKYNNDEIQIGIVYHQYRHHNRDCFPRLLNYSDTKEILKKCNFGTHKPNFDKDPDSFDDRIFCKYCGVQLKSIDNPIEIN